MNDDNDMVTLRLSRRDVGRLLVGVRERKRKFKKGLTKFADNFDAEKGVNLKEGFEAYNALEKKLQRKL